MKKAISIIMLTTLLAGCGAVQIGENPGQDKEKIITYYENGQKKSVSVPASGIYTEWYENGQLKFKAGRWVGERPLSWLPHNKTGRKVSRIILAPGLYGSYAFIYDEQNQSQVPWGAYDLYEGWYRNGQKKFKYEYPVKQYIEWNEQGRIIEKRKQ